MIDWLIDLECVCGRTSVRQVAVYDVADLSSAVHKIDLNTSPAILIPHYDEDCSVLFATGRASNTVALVPSSDACSVVTVASYISAFSRTCHASLYQKTFIS